MVSQASIAGITANVLGVLFTNSVVAAFPIPSSATPPTIVQASRKSPAGISITDMGTFESRKTWVGEEAGMWCADPENADSMLGITNTVRFEDFVAVGRSWGAFHNAVRVTTDGGRSWTQTLITDEAQQEFDPACVYGLNNNVFIASLPFQPGLNTTHNYTDESHAFSLWRSGDNGQTWGSPKRVNFSGWFDRIQLNLEHNRNGSPGRLYAAGATMSLPPHRTTRPGQIVVFTSDDQGESFSPAVTIPTGVGVGDGVIHLGNAVVAHEGIYSIAWAEGEIFEIYGMFSKGAETAKLRPPRLMAVKIATSRDHGRSFGAPVLVAYADWNSERDGVFTTFGKWYPSLAVSETVRAYPGRLYLAWPDAEQDAQYIRFAYSDNKGETWSSPSTISGSSDPVASSRGPFAGMVSLAVSAKGVVGALFYEQDVGSTDGSVWPKFTISRDGGINWSNPIRVTKYPLTPPRAAASKKRPLSKTSARSPRFDEPGPIPTCNYGLTVDANGDFRLFILQTVAGQLETKSVLIRVI